VIDVVSFRSVRFSAPWRLVTGCQSGSPYLASAAVTDEDELEGRGFGHVEDVWTRRARMCDVRCFVGFVGVSGCVATTRFSVARVVLWLRLMWMWENLLMRGRKC
jgi:hypothetical protein